MKIKYLIRLLLIGFVSLYIWGCGSPSTSIPAPVTAALSSDKATIVIKRERHGFFRSLASLSIWCGDRLIGTLATDQQLSWQCNPGELTIKVVDADNVQQLVDTVEAGKVVSYTVNHYRYFVNPTFMQGIYILRDDFEYGPEPTLGDLVQTILYSKEIAEHKSTVMGVSLASYAEARDLPTDANFQFFSEEYRETRDSGLKVLPNNIRSYEKVMEGQKSASDFLLKGGLGKAMMDTFSGKSKPVELLTTKIYGGNTGNSGWIAFYYWNTDRVAVYRGVAVFGNKPTWFPGFMSGGKHFGIECRVQCIGAVIVRNGKIVYISPVPSLRILEVAPGPLTIRERPMTPYVSDFFRPLGMWKR